MKKNILFTVALLSFGLTNAQKDMKFGVKAALNFSTLTGDLSEASGRVGFAVGGFAQFKLSDKFAVQPEVMYSGQGASYSESDSDLNGSYAVDGCINLGYILVPIMAQYYVTDAISLEFGPQIGFLIGAKNTGDIIYTTGNTSFGESFDEDIDNTKSIDFGLNFGAGYDISDNMTAGIRWNLGLNNVIENEDGSDFESKNSVISLSFGYKF